MVEQVIAYNRAYLANNQQYRDKGLFWAAGDALFVLPAIAAALARIAALRREPLNALEIGATVWLGSGVALLVAQGLIFDHYLTSLGPRLTDGSFVAAPCRLDATHSRPLEGIPASGRKIAVHCVFYCELAPGPRLRRVRTFFDAYATGVRLGLLPARGTLGERALLMLRGFGLRSRT